MGEQTMPITARCACGAIRYEATEPPQEVGYCIAPGSLDTSLSQAAGLSDVVACHARRA